ncbi:hypothetical protein V6N13_034372 [Hibiscus sabdariffa]|uniref:NET domain-containing protein n=1 Tax=Hibiscus sabdariffa TaxID=183260 RepID=A0ABR2P355_9ROSI
MSKCPWLALRRELQKMIQKLPNENLVRVVEVIQCGRQAGNTCGEEIFVSLEKEEKCNALEIILLSQSSQEGQNACTIAMLDNLNIIAFLLRP